MILKSYISKVNFIDLDNVSEDYDDVYDYEYDEYDVEYDDDFDEYYEYNEAYSDGVYKAGDSEAGVYNGGVYKAGVYDDGFYKEGQYVYGINDIKAYSFVQLADKLYDDYVNVSYIYIGVSIGNILYNGENISYKLQSKRLNNKKSQNKELTNDEIQISNSISNDNKVMSPSDIPMMQDKDVFNILLVGSDSRESKDRGRSDAIMILSINKNDEKIILTSFLRDIFVDIPGKKSNRLNVAYSAGGPSLLIKTIENNFRIKIDKYASVDFFAFIDIVDAIGGVNISVTEDELPILNDYVNDINLLLEEDYDKDILKTHGNHMLNGKQALGYCRIRYVGTDFARTGRQRAVLEQIFYKVKNSNISKLNDLLNTLLPKITTNLDEGEIISYLLNLKKYLGYDISQWSVPMSGTYKNVRIRKMAVLDIDFKKNIEEIRNRIY